MKLHGKLQWRYSLQRYYFEDDKYSYGYVNKVWPHHDRSYWGWVTEYEYGSEKTLKAAKKKVEKLVRKKCRT